MESINFMIQLREDLWTARVAKVALLTWPLGKFRVSTWQCNFLKKSVDTTACVVNSH